MLNDYEDNEVKYTIIIPVRGELPLLHRLLESVGTQSRLDLLAEVIVVENGSKVFSQGANFFFNLRYLSLPEGNRSRARNLGAQMAQTDRLIFLDADIMLPPNWLAQLEEYWTDSVDVIQGAIIPSSPLNTRLQRLRLWRGVNAGTIPFLSFTHPLVKKRVINSSCFGISQKLFEKNGGFDESFVRHEDLDFTQRLIRQSCRIRIAPVLRAQVYYSGTYLEYFKREFECGFHIVRFHEKWSSPSVTKALLSWTQNIIQLCRPSVERLQGMERIEKKLLALTFLVGSLVGLVGKALRPYSYNGKKFDEQAIEAQVEIR